jgi:phosphopantothenoylcysteine decarboxylase/phosphopantothenate--cysteine ligase
MAAAVWEEVGGVDAVVLTAAVADYRPTAPAAHKLRRADGPPEIALEPTPDILAGVANMADRPILVGFAAEVGSLDGAVAKAISKGVDLLVGNDVAQAGSGFGTDTNQVAFISPDGSVEHLPMLGKDEVAARLWERVMSMLASGATAR